MTTDMTNSEVLEKVSRALALIYPGNLSYNIPHSGQQLHILSALFRAISKIRAMLMIYPKIMLKSQSSLLIASQVVLASLIASSV